MGSRYNVYNTVKVVPFKKILSLFFYLTVLPIIINAQSLTVQATGTVLEPIDLTGKNLQFKAVYPGVTKAVNYSNQDAASFYIDGEPEKEITADFTLPSSLIHSGGLHTLSISFGATSAGHKISDNANTATDYDPNNTLTTILGATDGLLYIWLGGTVDPTIIQEKGDYSGDIVLDIAYSGN